ncbi:putative aldouronate transport system permease protein [Anaerocolumna jejuensis DSM 15929]|uniref:Putative aldouronate transport system permease protein n=1 Tax=Anaerocolumna jejuensis DSM 15929 TaxID=1121322 RepID=A0A1M6P1T2_9FIRM|nr:ABC transporter permease subunit [Anaerocolumna jejuensis]SHK01939.1 putative aldouronate transport system permease protein [Anaerocolumna jejuensis DSM 15929]
MLKNKYKQFNYHLMLLPGTIVLLIFSYIPMLGLVMAFQKYVPAKGFFKSKWVGLDNIIYMINLPDSKLIFANTLIIAVQKIVVGLIVAIGFALLLNEIRLKTMKKTIQTLVYLPHFLSWVVLATVVRNIFDYTGPVNSVIQALGGDPIIFLASNSWFRPIMIITSTWKEFGFDSVVYLAALTAIDPGLYEAASLDGANRFHKMIHVTLPGIAPTIVLMTALSLGKVLNAGFDQIFNLYNPLVYETADIIDTYVYRIGLVDMQYSLATAVGLMKSVIGFILIMSSNLLAKKFANYQIF